MRTKTGIIIGLALISLIAPVFAALPSNADGERAGLQPNMPIVNSAYSWVSPLTIDLSGINPAIFGDELFRKEPGGVSSGSSYTESIRYFLNSDHDAGVSKVSKKPANLGLVHWP